MNNKLYLAAYIKGSNPEAREISAIASMGVVDRDKEIIRWSAWQGGLEAFRTHPILLVNHNYSALWVARVTSIDPQKSGLFFTAKFSTTPEAESAWVLIRETQTAAFSVGFVPVESSMVQVRQLEPAERSSALALGMSDTDLVRVYTKVKLLEISLCSVPSCPTALLTAWKGKTLKDKVLNDAMQTWQEDIDLAALEPKIDKAVTQAIAQMDLPGQIAGAVKERARELRNEEWREYFLKQIMEDWRAAQAADKKAEAQRREIARLGETDLKSPEQLEAYAKASIATIDMEGLIEKSVTLAIAKARGKIY